MVEVQLSFMVGGGGGRVGPFVFKGTNTGEEVLQTLEQNMNPKLENIFMITFSKMRNHRTIST